MHADFEALMQIDRQSSLAGDASDWTVVTREDYLENVAPRGQVPLAIQSIVWVSPNEAVVTSVSSMLVNGKPTALECVRRFVRSGNDWRADAQLSKAA